MTKYVCGFAFNENMDHVALIHKLKPEWQAGKINGIGGKIEENESPSDAIEREFHEEAGLIIPSELWSPFVVMSGKDWQVYFMRVFGIDLKQVETMEDEKIETYSVYSLPENVIHNLRWLIPMALDLDIHTPINMEMTTS